MADRLGFLRLRSGRMVWVFQALTSTFGKEVPVLSISPESSVTATPKSFHSPTHPVVLGRSTESPAALALNGTPTTQSDISTAIFQIPKKPSPNSAISKMLKNVIDAVIPNSPNLQHVSLP
ncbi:hypothetical protein LXL04_013722 [Taraxacum kok-saghyz]